MPDMTLLDTSCFGEMNRGNRAVAQGIDELIRNGEIVAVPNAVYLELKNSPDPVTRTADLKLIEDRGIRVLPDPGSEARARMYEIHAEHQPGEVNKRGQDLAGQARTGGVGASATNKDVVVVAEVMHYTRNPPAGANNVRFFTMERMKTNPEIARGYGIVFSPNCSRISGVPTGSPRVDYSTVRGYFTNLKPLFIAKDGKVVPYVAIPQGGTTIIVKKDPPPGGNTATNPPAVRGGNTAAVEPRPPDPGFKGSPGDIAGRQEAVGGGGVMALAIADYGLNKLNDLVLKQDVESALGRVKPFLEQELRRNPSQGVLIVIYCRRPIPHPDSVIRPGDRFDHLEYGFGMNADDARQKMNTLPSIRQGADDKTEKIVTTEKWWPAAMPVGVGQLPTPYPKIAMACFSFGKAVLQDVEWNGTFGFDDEGETKLNTGSAIPTFFVLKPPSEIKWAASAWAVDRHAPPLLEIDAAKGGKITVVNLDPDLKFFGVSAAMVYPANDETWALFQSGPETKGATFQLGRQNFAKVRWIRPENLEIIQRF